MIELSLNEPAGVLVKTTCVDFPGRVAGSFFLKGCNLRCPYCYNGELLKKSPDIALSTIQDLFNHLEKRQGILSGLVISGGEPLLNPHLLQIIKKAKELNYKVKLDTNGTLPEELNSLLSNPEYAPDFVAMDIKTAIERYKTELNFPEVNKIKDSIDLLAALPPDAREYRTVLVPGLITKNDIQNIADFLPKDASWQFAQFQNSNCLNPEYNKIIPYTDEEISELVNCAKEIIPGANLR